MKSIRMKVASCVAGAGLTAAALVGAAAPASATSCASGTNTATVGWATCWGGPVTFRLILNCYAYPQVVTDWRYIASGSSTIYANCPSWSHITETFYQTQG